MEKCRVLQSSLVNLLRHPRLPDPLVSRLLIAIDDDVEQGRMVCVRDSAQGRDQDLPEAMERSQRW